MNDRDQAPGGAGGDSAAVASTGSASFEPVPYERWRQRVEKELRGAPFESLVSATSPGGISVEPVYHRRPWGEGEDPRGLPGAPPYVRGARPAGEAAGWLRCTRIDAPDLEAAKAALAADLRGGCDGVWLELDPLALLGAELPEIAARMSGERRAAGVPVSTPKALAALLEGVDLERVTLFLGAGGGSMAAAGLAFQALPALGADPGGARLFLGLDPVGDLARDGSLPQPLDELEAMAAAHAARAAAEMPRSRALTVSALPWHEAGAGPVQELGWTMATLARYLRRLEQAGLDLASAAGQVVLRIAPGRDLFLGIAKLRALRLCWSKLLAACAVDGPPPPFIHAVSSDLALTRRDPWNNLLRVTGEVFAAIAGGADAITAAPYDRLLRSAGEPAGSRLGRRVARNLQHVLAEEAHLGKVADPGGGSYYLETLTEELARRAWDEMRRVEAAGGIAEHLRSGRLQRAAEAAWCERRQALIEGLEPVLGVSVYPPPGGEDARGSKAEGPPAQRGGTGPGDEPPGGERIEPLPRHRLAEPFEDEGVAPPARGGGAEGEA